MSRSPRCQSWKPGRRSQHQPPHLPGRCRRCWRPCHNRVPPSVRRCDECTSLLLLCPSARVRLALASEAEPDPKVIAALAADPDLMIASTALWQQDRQDSTE